MSYDFNRQDQILKLITEEDCKVLAVKDRSYDGSWRKRGGVGAFMMLARKWDRLESMAEKAQKHGFEKPLDIGDGKKRETYSGYVQSQYDIFAILQSEDNLGITGQDGSAMAEIRDLRRYLALVEAYFYQQKEVSSYRSQQPVDKPYTDVTLPSGEIVRKKTNLVIPRGTATSENILKAEQAIAGVEQDGHGFGHDPDHQMEHAVANNPDGARKFPIGTRVTIHYMDGSKISGVVAPPGDSDYGDEYRSITLDDGRLRHRVPIKFLTNREVA